jgi:transposase-like protein
MQDSGHTSDWTGQTVERHRSNGKRIFVSAFKAWIVEQACKPSTSVAGLAMRHGVNANLLRRWMKLAGQDGAPAPVMLPVNIVQARPVTEPTSSTPVHVTVSTPVPIEIEVAGAVVRVYEGVDARRLRMVLEALRT